MEWNQKILGVGTWKLKHAGKTNTFLTKLSNKESTFKLIKRKKKNIEKDILNIEKDKLKFKRKWPKDKSEDLIKGSRRKPVLICSIYRKFSSCMFFYMHQTGLLFYSISLTKQIIHRPVLFVINLHISISFQTSKEPGNQLDHQFNHGFLQIPFISLHFFSFPPCFSRYVLCIIFFCFEEVGINIIEHLVVQYQDLIVSSLNHSMRIMNMS